MQLLAHMTFNEALFAMGVFMVGIACGFWLALRMHSGRRSEFDTHDMPP